MLALENHHLEIVTWLVIDPDCVKARNREKQSALHYAALNGNFELAFLLIKSLNSSDKSSLISSPDNNGMTAFFWSCSKGHLDLSKWLLEEYKSCKSESDPLLLTIQNNNRYTPFMLALENHHLEIVTWLVSIDPDCVKARNREKQSALHYVALNDNFELASILIKLLNSSDKSSLISSPDNNGMTAFCWSCSKGRLDLSKWLLEEYKSCKSESDPLLHTIQNNSGYTPFMLALENHHLEIVTWLVSIDPDCVKARNREKQSALHYAALNGNFELAFLLIKSLNSSDKSSLISSPDNNGMTAFFWSCSKGHLDLSKWLLEEYKICKSESDPLLLTIQNNNRYTPFMLALENHHLEIVTWLVSIDPHCVKARNREKQSALHYVALNDNFELASILIKLLNSSDKSSLISSPDNNGMTAFCWSCLKGRLDLSKWLLEEYKSCKSESDPLLHTIQNNNGYTPLMLAVVNQHLEIVSWLVSIDPDCVKTRNREKKSALHYAALNGNFEIASILIKSLNSSDKSSLISSPDNDGMTAFYWSCSKGHLDLSKWLLEEYKSCKSESDPLLHTIQNNNGYTPLMTAVMNPHFEIVSWLVSIDPDCVKTRNREKKSALHYAAEKGNFEIASVLLKLMNSSDKSSIISSPDINGMTAFYLSCSNKGYLEISKWLLEEYKNCKSESDQLLHTIQENDGYTPLMLAVVNQHLEIVRWLASIDPDCLKIRDRVKKSALHYAAEKGNFEIASVLLKMLNSSDKSSIISSQNNNGMTAFHLSCSEGHLEFSKWLLEEYKNCKSESDQLLHTIQGNDGYTPLMLAVVNQHLETVRWLASTDPDCMKTRNRVKESALQYAAEKGNFEIASVLLKLMNSSDKTSIISSQNNNGMTAFHLSCSEGHLEFSKRLLEEYQNCKSESDQLLHTIQGNDGYTPLMLAVVNQHLAIVRWLASIDPDCVKTRNREKQSALHYAAEKGNFEIASVLLKMLNSSDKSSIISSQNNNGMTAFHLLCSEGHLEFSKWLLEEYKNCKSESDQLLHTIQGNDGYTPLMLAVVNQHLAIVRWLASIDPDCVKTRNREKQSALHYAAEKGNFEIASVLLKLMNSSDKTSIISSQNNNGLTAFHLSCSEGHLEFSKRLLEEYQNYKSESDQLLHTIQGNDGYTPLMLAVVNQHLAIVRWLVSIDPDCMKTRNKNEASVLHYAAANNNTYIASVLLKALKSSDKFSLISSPDNNGLTAFFWSCSKGQIEFSKWLLEEYKNCKSESDQLLHTIQDNDGYTPLMLAVVNQHLEIVHWLASIDPDCAKTRNREKQSALHYAALNDNFEIASILIKSSNSSEKSSLISSPDNNGMNAFYWSCSKGHLEFSKWLLEEYKNCKSESDQLLHTIQGTDGYTPLMTAVMNQHLETVKWLVSIDPDCVKTRNREKQSALHYAALHDNFELASILIKLLNSSDKNSLISSPDNNGLTAFYWSCSKGHLEFSKWLLEEYKNCKSESDQLLHTIQGNDGYTPLMLAVVNQHLEIVHWLASIDPDCMKTRNRVKESALHYAAEKGNFEIASVLLKLMNSSDKASIISSQNNNGMTTFHLSCSEGHLEFSKWLLEEYKNCKSESDQLLHTFQGNDGYTPLMLAVVNQHHAIVRWLVSIDPDWMRTRNKNEASVLHYAAANNNTDIASVLLKALKSSDKFSLISSPDNNGLTAFFWSCSQGQIEFSKWLLEEYKKCKSESDQLLHTIQDNDGYTPLMLAVVNQHLEVVRWLASIDPDCVKTRNREKQSALHYAALNDNFELASILIKSLNSSDKTSLISSPDNNGMTAFYWSCSQGQIEFSKWLLEEYKNCKSESDQLLHTIQDNDGYTPLMLAVVNQHLEIVRWLASIDPDCVKTQNREKQSALHYAALNDNFELASILIKSLNSSDKSSLISSSDNNGMTAFYWSCSKGHLEFSKWLLEEYKNCKSESDQLLHTIQGNDGYTPLMLAVVNQHLEIVRWLASIDPDCVKTRNREKQSALHYAALYDNFELASILIKSLNSSDKSSLISSPDNFGMTAFYWSCSQGQIEFSKWLLEEYKNCKSESDQLLHTFQDNDGYTPLMLAVVNQHLEIVRWLASIDPDCVKTRNREKQRALHYAALNDNFELASVLIKSLNSSDKSSLISSSDNNGMTAFYWSCSKGHLEFSKWLLEEYKNCKSESDQLLHTIQGNDGYTPLMLAVVNQHPEIVRWLASIDPDCMKTRNRVKESALHYAAEKGNFEIASVLLKLLNSSDKTSIISSQNNNGMTAFHLSCSEGHLEFSKWLLEEYKNCKSESDQLLHTIQGNDGYTPLMLAVVNQHLAIVRWLVSIDPDCMKTRNKNEASVLHYAAANNNTDIASVLLKALKSSDKFSLISSPDKNGLTAFFWSCLQGQIEFSKWLLEEYKNCKSESDQLLHTIQDNDGYTPLMLAVVNQHLEIVRWLASIDPDCVKTQNREKQSALHYAALNDNFELASILIKSLNSSDKSSLISSPDNKGMTVFYWSCSKGHLEFSKWLLEEYKSCKSESDQLLHTIQGNDGYTPLMLAVVNQHLEIVRWLASIDPDCMKTRNRVKESALHYAAEKGNFEIASVLLKLMNSSDKTSMIYSQNNNGMTAFHLSCSEGHLEFSKWLLEQYKNCKSESDQLLHTIQGNDGYTPLMLAVVNQHLAIVRWLVSIDPDCIKTRNKNEASVLHYAASNNNTDIASVLLKALKSSDKFSLISSPDNNGLTAFFWSCSQGQLEFSKWLLEEYKNCKSESDQLLHTIQDNDGYTPLMLAVVNQHLEIVRWLASIDPDCVKTRNREKQSALHYAAQNDNFELASILIKSLNSSDKNTLISSPDNNGMTAFHWSCSKGHLEFSKWLLEEYKNCKSEFDQLLHTIQGNDGYTPLMLAAVNQHLEIVRWLASIDPDCMKTRNRVKKSALHYAAEKGNFEIASILLKLMNSSDKTSMISSQNNNGMTAFHLSCSEGHLEFSKWLLEEYKNCKSEFDQLLHTIQGNDGYTPLMLAAVNQHLEIVRWLASIDPDCMKTRNRVKESALHYAAEKGNFEIASVLLNLMNSSDKTSIISSQNNNGMTAFHLSCSEGHLKFSKLLLEEYKNCKSESDQLLHTIQGNDGYTPLMLAVGNQHLEIVRWLVSIDPDCMKKRNKNEASVLHYAAANNNTDIASVLLKALKSSDKFSLISSPDNNGLTAFFWSCSQGQIEFSKWLLEEYKNCKSESDQLLHTIQDNDGNTPLMQAMLHHQIETVRWLASIDPDCSKTRNRKKRSALHNAAAHGDIEIASVLLKLLNSSDKSSMISSPDINGMTAFYWSCSKGHLDFSRWLLEEYKSCKSETDPLLHTIQDNKGCTPLMQAMLSHHLEIVSWLARIDPDCMKT